MRNIRLFSAALLCVPLAVLAADVSVIGLFNGKAVLVVNGGKPRTISAGESTPEGVRLVSATSESAIVEIEGRRHTLTPGQGSYVTAAKPGSGASRITLTADSRGHFTTIGSINGVTLRFLVDTGATSVALSSTEARRLGINYLAGTRGHASTANGVVTVYNVKLDVVRIGEIAVNNVDASIVEGTAPPIALLGMSFLSRMDMKHDGATMTLTRRY